MSVDRVDVAWERVSRYSLRVVSGAGPGASSEGCGLGQGGEQRGVDEQDDTLSETDEGHWPIPVELHSVYESGPFTRCTICNGPLHSLYAAGEPETFGTVPIGHEDPSLDGAIEDDGFQGNQDADDSQAIYEIQKVFRGSEVLFEMAICRRCGEQVAKEFSEESIEAMKGFLLSNFKPDKDASHCHFCTFPLALLEGWTMVGACREDRLIFPPIILCEPCSENLQQRLSKTTRDVQDEFIRDHFPGVPADLDLSPSVFGV